LQGSSRYGCVGAGWPEVSTRGNVRVTFSCQRIQQKILDLVKDEPELSAAELIRMDEERWLIEQFWKDTTQLPWLGQYQNRPCRAAVTHLHLMCFADALPTRLCLQRAGAQGQ
jgi:hypothetical protein